MRALLLISCGYGFPLLLSLSSHGKEHCGTNRWHGRGWVILAPNGRSHLIIYIRS